MSTKTKLSELVGKTATKKQIDRALLHTRAAVAIAQALEPVAFEHKAMVLTAVLGVALADSRSTKEIKDAVQKLLAERPRNGTANFDRVSDEVYMTEDLLQMYDDATDGSIN